MANLAFGCRIWVIFPTLRASHSITVDWSALEHLGYLLNWNIWSGKERRKSVSAAREGQFGKPPLCSFSWINNIRSNGGRECSCSLTLGME
jgi:hypothetical protein